MASAIERGSRCSLPAPPAPDHTPRTRQTNLLESIASSCGGGCEAEQEPALRGARSLDALVLAPRMRRQLTSRSLDVAAPLPLATVCGSPALVGDAGGVPADDARTEASPLLRKCSLYNKPERVRAKPRDAYIDECQKRWRSLSLEHVDEGKGERKLPRFAIRSWLLGLFGAVPRGSSASLRRTPALLDRESAV